MLPIVHALLAIFVVIATAVLAIVVFKNNARSATNRILTSLSILTILWLLVIYGTTLPQSPDTSLWLIRINIFLAIPQVIAFYLLSRTLPHARFQITRANLIAIVCLAVIGMSVTISPFAFTEVVVTPGQNPQPVVGWGIGIFMLEVVGFSLATIVTLVHRTRRAKKVEKQQLLFMTVGIAMMLGLIITTILIPATLLGVTSFVSLAPLYVLGFLAMTSYAIIRHRLMDIRLIVVRSVTYSLTVSILLLAYVGIVMGLSTTIYGSGELQTDRLLINAILAVFIGATFQPLKRRMEIATNQIFYQNDYQGDKLAASITAVMAETFRLEELAGQSLEKITDTMNITSATFWVADKEKFKCVASVGHKSPPKYELRDLILLSQSDHMMIFEEDTDNHQKIMRHMGITVALPLYAGESLQGLIVLGSKKSGDVYTDKDINVLRILGPGLATALENASSYQQISNFNTTLRREIDKATSQLREANEQLSRKNHQLQELDKLKDEFISVTSHELRTPLTAIRGYLWMVMNNKKGGSHKEYLDRAYTSSERLIDLVNDTLDISRIESGRVELDPVPTDLPHLVRQVAEELEPKAKERHQRLTVSRAGHLPSTMCDPDKIHQVLINLIGNALKFTPANGTINIHFYADRGHVVTAITDNGPGISLADQRRLFQKFSRVGHTSDIPGTGLGLYLCQQIVRLSKGRIWVDSVEGKGSTFFFSLPVSRKQNSLLTRSASRFKSHTAA